VGQKDDELKELLAEMSLHSFQMGRIPTWREEHAKAISDRDVAFRAIASIIAAKDARIQELEAAVLSALEELRQDDAYADGSLVWELQAALKGEVRE
jgi:hypothetical protein